MEHRGYSVTHPWYFRLGGPIPTADEIVELARHEPAKDDCLRLVKVMKLREPKRGVALRELLIAIKAELEADKARYAEQAERVQYRRRWLGPWPDEGRDMWNEPTDALSLKVNHIRYNVGQIRAIEVRLDAGQQAFDFGEAA